jgi:hypothetical protein
MGGFLHPDDIKSFDEDTIRGMLDSGKYTIDWVDGPSDLCDDNVFFIRFRHVNGRDVEPSFGGRCVMLTDEGCSLPFEERAYGCRSLIPAQTLKCGDGAYTKDLVVKDWNVPEYQQILEKFVDERYDMGQQLDDLLDMILGRGDY